MQKNNNIPTIIVGHITKDGDIAGPKLLEHMVDTVLYIEGDKQHMFRLLRVRKNRFGDDSEVGIFEMTQDGLMGIENPSAYLMQNNAEEHPGSCINITMEGSRAIAIEVQALVAKSPFGFPKRAVNGISLNKLQLLCAVLQRHTGVELFDQDVFVNIASGMQIKEPGVDLAICAAIISSYLNKSIKPDVCFFGEVGLPADIRKVYGFDKRKKESKKLGFRLSVNGDNIKNLQDLFQKIQSQKL